MLNEVVDVIKKARKGVVLTGAGISAESGVPTFRGQDGLWKSYRAEELATMEAFLADPKIVWEWYNWRRGLIKEVAPNPGHYAIAQLPEFFEEFILVTQNVDGLHRMAGSDPVLELHGNIMRSKCVRCERIAGDDLEIDPDNIAECEHCGGKMRPDVVWFGEMLPGQVIEEAFHHSGDTDVFLSVGTSALVHPAASLPMVARRAGAVLVEINPDQTPLTELADFYFPRKSGELLPELISLLKESSVTE